MTLFKNGFAKFLLITAGLMMLSGCTDSPDEGKETEETSSYPVEASGTAYDDEEYFITPHDVTYDTGVLQVLDCNGKITKEITLPAYAYNFRKLKYADGTIRYAYQQVICESKYPGGIYEDTYLTLLDENFNVVKENIGLLKSDMVPQDNWPLENHDYEVLDDSHYILMTVVPVTVTDIDGYTGEGYNLYNCIIQEQKDGEVVWEFQTIDYPELYPFCHNYADTAWDWTDETYQKGSGNYNDYIHFNSLSYDEETDSFLLSYRCLGIIKVDRKTKNIEWILSSMSAKGVESDLAVDVSEFAEENPFGYFQHDVRNLGNGSFTVFDNHIVSGILDVAGNGKCRVLKFTVDDSSKKLTAFESNECPVRYSPFMGSAELLDSSTNTWLIAYGGYLQTPAFHIYSFSTQEELFSVQYTVKDKGGKGLDLYNVCHGACDSINLKDLEN